MPLPTLLVSGKLIYKGKYVTNETPLSFIQKWIRKRMYEYGNRSNSLNDRILVVRSETGSGKSTALPVGIFRILRDERTPAKIKYSGSSVICTQPRVLTAVTLAHDVSKISIVNGNKFSVNPDMVLGETVGYQTGELVNLPAQGGLLYATIGILAVQLQNAKTDDEIMNRYKFILIDEAHERSIESDVTLLLLRNFYMRNIGNDKLPFLLFLSATLVPEIYIRYFGLHEDNIIEVKGSTFSIENHWLQEPTNNYIEEAVKTAIMIHKENLNDIPYKADILIFFPGDSEFRDANELLDIAQLEFEKTDIPPFLLLKINREVVLSQSGDFTLTFIDPSELPLVNNKKPIRRIFLATSVAETGLTIDTLKYVIDSGWCRSMEIYPPLNAVGLITKPAPRSRIMQRKGRAGRKFNGHYYPMYTKELFDSLIETQLPDIITGDFGKLFLTLALIQLKQKQLENRTPDFRVEDIKLLTSPSIDSFIAANTMANVLGFIDIEWGDNIKKGSGIISDFIEDKFGGNDTGPIPMFKLSPIGEIGAKFNQDFTMDIIRILLAGYVWNVAASDLITAVAMFEFRNGIEDLLIKSPEKKELPFEAYALKACVPSFMNSFSGGAKDSDVADSELFYYRIKLLIADDFVSAIFIFDTFLKIFDITEDIVKIEKWCIENFINLKAMIELAGYRDAIIGKMIVAGLNPFRLNNNRLSTLPIEKFTNGLINFKRCLYDGLKMNLLKFDLSKGYVNQNGYIIKNPILMTDALLNRLKTLKIANNAHKLKKPIYLVTDKIKIIPIEKNKDNSLMYNLETNMVSYLDGFVDVDQALFESIIHP